MPVLEFHTNLFKSSIPGGFLEEVTDLLVELVNKERRYMCVHIRFDEMMAYGGTTDPCGLIHISSIGKIGGELNKPIAEKLFEKIGDRLGIAPDRLCIFFHDVPGSECAWNRTTFAGKVV